ANSRDRAWDSRGPRTWWAHREGVASSRLSPRMRLRDFTSLEGHARAWPLPFASGSWPSRTRGPPMFDCLGRRDRADAMGSGGFEPPPVRLKGGSAAVTPQPLGLFLNRRPPDARIDRYRRPSAVSGGLARLSA